MKLFEFLKQTILYVFRPIFVKEQKRKKNFHWKELKNMARFNLLSSNGASEIEEPKVIASEIRLSSKDDKVLPSFTEAVSQQEFSKEKTEIADEHPNDNDDYNISDDKLCSRNSEYSFLFPERDIYCVDEETKITKNDTNDFIDVFQISEMIGTSNDDELIQKTEFIENEIESTSNKLSNGELEQNFHESIEDFQSTSLSDSILIMEDRNVQMLNEKIDDDLYNSEIVLASTNKGIRNLSEEKIVVFDEDDESVFLGEHEGRSYANIDLQKEEGIEIQSQKFLYSNYYRQFISRRRHTENLDDGEIDTFLEDLRNDYLDNIITWPSYKLENHLFQAIQRFEFIGELPVSNKAFTLLAEYIRKISGQFDQKRVPPVLYLVGMVFCARYSETEARRFWEPYAKLVWGLNEASQAFQQKNRKHFINCRQDLKDSLSLQFNYYNEGDVVRPVYQHAIIPHYLQDHFAEWLVNNFQLLLQYPAEQLPSILKNESSLDYVPRRLCDFIRGGDTEDTAANLIIQMAHAVNLFYETEQAEAVDSVINSSIEKSIWRAIYQKLIVEKSQLIQVRKLAPRLEWVWNLDNDMVCLNLSNVRSNQGEQPDSIIWTEQSTSYLKGEEIFIRIFPWKLPSGDWEVDSMNISGDGPLEGCVLVLSKEFDLEESKEKQSDHIIFERIVPSMHPPLLFFKVDKQKKFARRKNELDIEGEWIIVSDQKIQISDPTGEQIPFVIKDLPYRLVEVGFKTAIQCDIQFPIIISSGEQIISIEKSSVNTPIIPYLEGKFQIDNLSETVPPVFLNADVSLRFSINTKYHPLHRTWLSIQRGGEFIQSILLADLYKRGWLNLDGNNCIIQLKELLSRPGAYSVNLLHNLKSLLDEPVYFCWLPEDITVEGPDPDICYSPINPLEVVIRGISTDQLISYDEAKSKIIEQDNEITVLWKIVKDPVCRFAIKYESSQIRFAWDIQRVSAWIEGGGDYFQVRESQEQDVVLQVRGQKNEPFSWIIEGGARQRNTKLNARGEFQANLVETIVRDLLKEDDQTKTSISIAIRGYNWKLFDYYKANIIEIIEVNYCYPQLKIKLTQSQKLRGAYTIQVRHVSDQLMPEVLSDLNVLEENLAFQIGLHPGEYRLEILLHSEIIISSPAFFVEEEPAQVEKINDVVQVIENFGSPEHLFRGLTSKRQELFSQGYDGLSITPSIEQLQLIHTPEEWLTDERWNEGLKRLLPSWAVLMYPLRLTTKIHRRILHVFPEKVSYGGRAGRGYIELKLEDEKMRIAASWRPRKDSEYSQLWMGISQEQNIKFYSELDQDELWPAYLCKDCGTIVASRNGTYLKLPPSLVKLHQHGENRKLKEQFIDTVYDDQNSVEVSVSQYEEKPLAHIYWVKEAIINNYLQDLIEGRIRPIHGDLGKPIDLFSSIPYGLAISDLFEHLQQPEILKLQRYLFEFDRLKKYMGDEQLNNPAFSAMNRLMKYVCVSTSPLNIPGDILTLAMILRLKANNPRSYENLLINLDLSEGNLIKVVEYATQGCPKLLEWSIAWAELFFVHTIS